MAQLTQLNTIAAPKLTYREYNLLLVEQQLVALRDRATTEDQRLLIQQLLVMWEVLFHADMRVTTGPERYTANYDYPA